MPKPSGHRKPRELAEAEGYRKDRILKNPVQSPPGIPEPPAHLKDEALACWHRMAPLLQEMGVLAMADRDALSLYCVLYARHLAAEEHIRIHGQVLIQQGRPAQTNPSVATQGHVATQGQPPRVTARPARINVRVRRSGARRADRLGS